MRRAFYSGASLPVNDVLAYIKEFGDFDKAILPKEDIEESFNAKDAKAFFAEINGKRVGGAVVLINEETQMNSLDLLYVSNQYQNLGIGYKLFKAIEDKFPSTKMWVTHTPYYDKRNIDFYVNCLGFKIVEFFSPKHCDPHQKGETSGNIPIENNLFFRFEKKM